MGTIIISIIVVVFVAWSYNTIDNRIKKSRAERRLRQYPNAVKAVFGFNYEVSINKPSDVNQLNAPAYPESFWINKEKEELEILKKCNTLRAKYKNGWESWVILNPKLVSNIHKIDESTQTIINLEKSYANYLEYQDWFTSQKNYCNDSPSGIIISCRVECLDRFGNKDIEEVPITHTCIKEEKCKSGNVEIRGGQDNNISAIMQYADTLSSNIEFIILPSCYKYENLIRNSGYSVTHISDVGDRTWNIKQKFVVLTDIADEIVANRVCSMLFDILQNKPLLLFISIIKTVSDAEFNMANYRAYSPDYNSENSFEQDNHVEIHPFENGYYYTIDNISFNSIKKAISRYFNVFDTQRMAQRMEQKYKHSWGSEYHGKSAAEIVQMWSNKRDESAKSIKELREDIQAFFEKRKITHNEAMELFMQFNAEWKISPYRTNWTIYDRNAGLVATVDCLAFNDSKYTLFSWVRTDSALEEHIWGIDKDSLKFLISDDSRDIYTKWYHERGIKNMACEKLRDCKITKYSIEQKAVINILKNNYGINVEESYIVILHPTYKKPIAFRPENVEKEVSQFLIQEKNNNKKRPTLESEFSEQEKSVIYKEDVETIDTIELF